MGARFTIWITCCAVFFAVTTSLAFAQAERDEVERSLAQLLEKKTCSVSRDVGEHYAGYMRARVAKPNLPDLSLRTHRGVAAFLSFCTIQSSLGCTSSSGSGSGTVSMGFAGGPPSANEMNLALALNTIVHLHKVLMAQPEASLNLSSAQRTGLTRAMQELLPFRFMLTRAKFGPNARETYEILQGKTNLSDAERQHLAVLQKWFNGSFLPSPAEEDDQEENE